MGGEQYVVRDQSVLVVYRDAKVEVTDTGLILTPSPPHVRARRLSPRIST